MLAAADVLRAERFVVALVRRALARARGGWVGRAEAVSFLDVGLYPEPGDPPHWSAVAAELGELVRAWKAYRWTGPAAATSGAVSGGDSGSWSAPSLPWATSGTGSSRAPEAAGPAIVPRRWCVGCEAPPGFDTYDAATGLHRCPACSVRFDKTPLGGAVPLHRPNEADVIRLA